MTAPAHPPGASRIRRASDPTDSKPSALLRWLPALPALISLAGVAGFFIIVSAQNSDRTTAWYKTQAASAMQSRDFKTARLCFGRLLTAAPNDPTLLFGLAQSLDGMGQPLQSRQILNQLAPIDRAGYTPAHLMVAEQLLEMKHTPDVLAAAEIHLRRVLDADPGNAGMRGRFSKQFTADGEFATKVVAK